MKAKEAMNLLEVYRIYYSDAELKEATDPDGVCLDGCTVETMASLVGLHHRGILYYALSDDNRKLVVIASRQFGQNVTKMVKGSKVRYCDPALPHGEHIAEVVSDGIRYEGGAAVFDLALLDANCVEVAKGMYRGPYFALYWRPTGIKKP